MRNAIPVDAIVTFVAIAFRGIIIIFTNPDTITGLASFAGRSIVHTITGYVVTFLAVMTNGIEFLATSIALASVASARTIFVLDYARSASSVTTQASCAFIIVGLALSALACLTHETDIVRVPSGIVIYTLAVVTFLAKATIVRGGIAPALVPGIVICTRGEKI